MFGFIFFFNIFYLSIVCAFLKTIETFFRKLRKKIFHPTKTAFLTNCRATMSMRGFPILAKIGALIFTSIVVEVFTSRIVGNSPELFLD